MGNQKTPLIQKLRETGGTLVVFPSAAEDIGLNLQATTSGVAMSHYALLDIPEMKIEKCIRECSKAIQHDNDANLVMAMSLQNYAMNFETLLINQDSYNYQQLSTVSEKVFWHWAMHVGILNPSTLENVKKTDNCYIEKGHDVDPSTADDTVIKCFGSIDAGNSLSTEFGMFNETYITVPTSWGPGPVYLKSSGDVNFKMNYSYKLTSMDCLEGRDNAYSYYSYTDGQDYPFFDSSKGSNAYYDVGDIDGLEIVKDVNGIQELSRSHYDNDNIVIGSFDDVNIDSANYFGLDEEFDFNAVLLYYSVYDQDDMVKTAYATNLFGVIFLDGCEISSIADKTFVIPPLKKRKSTSQHFGNSYSFRVNLKTMSVYDNTDAIIQDNTTTSGISAVEFADAISNMNRAIDIMNSNLHTVQAIQDQYAAILTQYDNFQEDIDDLSTCINAYLKGTRSSFVDTSILYVNEIRPSEKSVTNNISITSRGQSQDENGNNVYETAIDVTDGNVYVRTENVSVLHVNESYLNLRNASIHDVNVKVLNASTTNANLTLDNMFDTSTELIVKVRCSDEITNSLYIDPNSSIFSEARPGISLKRLLDSSSNINYTEFIPYIIAEMQNMKEEIKKLKNQ